MPSLEKQKSNSWSASPQLERFTNCGTSLSTVTSAKMEVRTKISEEERKKLAEYRCVAAIHGD
jgi:hypothetical protein